MAGTCRIHYHDGAVEELEPVPADGRYPQQATARHLVDLVLGRGEVAHASSGELGVRVVELLEAAYRSAAERRVVRVDEL
jgi:predicted dehydrogenase